VFWFVSCDLGLEFLAGAPVYAVADHIKDGTLGPARIESRNWLKKCEPGMPGPHVEKSICCD